LTAADGHEKKTRNILSYSADGGFQVVPENVDPEKNTYILVFQSIQRCIKTEIIWKKNLQSTSL